MQGGCGSGGVTSTTGVDEWWVRICEDETTRVYFVCGFRNGRLPGEVLEEMMDLKGACGGQRGVHEGCT